MIWVVLGNYYNNWMIIMVDDDEDLMRYSRELEEDLDVNRSGDLRELVDEFGTS